jgi:hypothetical protein
MTWGLGAALFLQASVSSAKITWNLKPTGMGDYDWTLRQHWNFNKTGGSGTYGPCTNNNCNYHSLGDFNDGADVSWGGPGKAAPECLEVTTYPGAFTSNPDTVIEVVDEGSNWQRISDDFGGTLQSHARIWIEPVNTTMTFHLRIRAYSSGHNTDDFDVTITRRDISKAACTSNQTTIPWVQITDSPQLTFTMSTFH